MGLELADIKLYLRLDEDDNTEDKLLQGFVTAATSLIKEQSGKAFAQDGTEATPIEDNALFQTGVQQLVAHWYENRAVVTAGGNPTVIPYAAESIIRHISLCGDYV